MAHASSDRRSLAVLALAGLAAGCAIWLLPASQHIVSWQDGAPGRVALLAPLSRLVWTALAGVCLAGAAGWWWSRSGRPLETLARLVSPVLLLWLWVVPYLPWLPTEVPLILLLAGPVRWMVLGLAMTGCVVFAVESGPVRLGALRWPGRGFVFGVSLLVFLGVGQYVKQAQGFGGDEPHYLVIAHSLLADRDLQIENNHQNRDYLAFHPGELPMHYLARGRDDVIYSIHSPGLPALVLPAYAVAGHWGALALVGLIAALAALAVFDLASLLASRPVALATWAAVAFTIPFGLHSWLIFPEMPAALLMAWAALWVWQDRPDRPWLWVWRGVALSLLPWLHMKFSLLLFVAGLWLAFRLWPRARLVVAFLAPIAISAVLWLGSFYVLYGDANPTVAYGYSQGAQLAWLNIPRGLLGLSFDQEYGLLPYSPIFALSLVGAWVMARRRDTRGHLLGVVLVITPFLASTTQYYMWWGGGSAPARFVVPIVPLLAPMIAVAIRDLRGSAARGAIGLALSYSVMTFVVVVARPAAMLMYNDRDGTGRLVETVQAGVPLTAMLPSFIDPAILIQLPSTAVWVVAAVLAAVSAHLAARRAWTGPFWSAVVALLVFGGAGGVLAETTLSDTASRATVRAGRQRLLNGYPGARLEGFSYETGRWLREAELLDRATLEIQFAPGTVVDPSRLGQAFELPPGRYDLLVWFTEQQVGDGHVFVSYDLTGGEIARAHGRATNPAVVPLDLPIGLTALTVGATSVELANRVSGVAVVPRGLVPQRQRRDAGRVRAVKPVGERLGAYLFFMDLNTFVEPDINWVQGDHVSELLVSTAGADRMRVVIRNGGADNRIAVTVEDRTELFELAAWETRELALPVPPGDGLIPISIHPQGGFVPADVEPGSTDTRLLGCTVTVVLE
jgi:hypothetical protein